MLIIPIRIVPIIKINEEYFNKDMPVPALFINVGKKRAGNDIAKIVKIHIITLDLFEILVNSGTTAFVLTIEKIEILKNNNIKATGSIKNP
jgi:hypothetical protein